MGDPTDALAVMVEHQGDVQRDHADATGQFESADDHSRFFSGDALRTLEQATARLQLPVSGAVLVQSATTIRLWRGKRAGLQLNVQTGMASVVTDKEPVAVETALGLAVLQAGSELRVRPSARGGQRYEITLGRALLTTPDGEELSFGPGQTIALATELPAARPAARLPDSKVTPDAGAREGPARAPGPSQAAPAEASDLQLQPGASVTIFDPMPPSRVQLEVPASCTHGARARVRGKVIALSQTQALLLPAGRHPYQVACLDEAGHAQPASWRGNVRVVRNAGTARMPKSAPRNTIEADGRSYTVLFQNIPPVLEVSWPGAPSAAEYTIVARLQDGRELRRSSREPRQVFAAGALPEGRHQFHFEQRGGGAHSRTTTVTLRFDNASPTASLRLPPVAGFLPGEPVAIAGIALPGAQVSVLGQPLNIDSQGRFAGEVAVPTGVSALAVRIHHPRTGTRYYVRRVRASP